MILRSYKLLGVIFVVLLLVGVWLTYAVFTKKFTDYDRVSLQTSNIGLQLPNRADVKIRGVIVGEVLDATSRGDGAELTLGIFPDKRDLIPANVTGSIVPKTLFGEKYVSLVVPQEPAAEPLATGASIERTVVSTEVEEVLADLYPLLRTVQPAEINMTLNALVTALEGRGDQLGRNLETVDSYLKRLNPQIPLLVEDLRLTSQVSDTYSDVLPEVATILENTITTTTTLEDRKARLAALFKNVSQFSGTAETFLRDNGDNLIKLGDVSRTQLQTLARYASGFPCLLKGIVNIGALQAEAFRGYTLHIILETIPNQPRKYTPADKPRFGADDGPDCINLPNPPWTEDNPARRQPDFDDGVDSPTGKGTSRAGASYRPTGIGYAGGTAESDVLKELLGPVIGGTASDVDDLGVLLLAPMARGNTVSMGEAR
ncbi:MCE family protein [Nocardioides sp. SYSU D00038]|uniref:MCE family protein n=1 Tax=Nocardioides sp. SYSU D00038 TaxID=2812554 RepID=UPI0019681264|nr:MCE family protein [Nocardioides sp. SYSU D00038]